MNIHTTVDNDEVMAILEQELNSGQVRLLVGSEGLCRRMGWTRRIRRQMAMEMWPGDGAVLMMLMDREKDNLRMCAFDEEGSRLALEFAQQLQQ